MAAKSALPNLQSVGLMQSPRENPGILKYVSVFVVPVHIQPDFSGMTRPGVFAGLKPMRALVGVLPLTHQRG